MSCNKYDDKLSFYVLNELSEAEVNEIDEHIKSCYSCSRKVKELGTLMDGLSIYEDVDLPEDFHENCLSRAEKELWTGNKKQIPYKRFVKYASAAAVFALCIFSATHLNIFSSAKKDMAIADKGVTSSSASSTKNAADGSLETTTGTVKDDKSTEYGSSSPQNSKEVQTPGMMGNTIQSTILQDKYSENSEVNGNTTVDNKGSADTSASKSSNTVEQDTTAETKTTQPAEDIKTEAKRSALTASQPVELKEASRNVQIKTNNLETAYNLIEEQAAKVSSKAQHSTLTTGQTTQDSTYSDVMSFVLKSAVTEKTVTVEVKKEYVEQFKALLEQAFGKDNIHYEADENSSAETIKFIIRLTL
jgi:Predicted transmembrane transcriptional regulator (anti-sigma factor)